MAFTLVFRGDIRSVGGNPFKIDTPFGALIACGLGDAFAERDRIEDIAGEMLEALREYPSSHADLIARATTALES